MDGRWVWVPIEKSSEGGWLGCLAGIIIFTLIIGFFYGLVKPDYEFDSEENHEIGYFGYEHFIFFSGFSVEGEIHVKSESGGDEYSTGTPYSFKGSYTNSGIDAMLDSAGTVWNGGEKIRIELPNDSTAIINGRKIYGGSTWINVPII